MILWMLGCVTTPKTTQVELFPPDFPMVAPFVVDDDTVGFSKEDFDRLLAFRKRYINFLEEMEKLGYTNQD